MTDVINQTYEKQRQMLLAAGRSDIDHISESERANLVLEYISHLQEELVELRMELPRRFWRNDEVNPFETDRSQFDSELVDCWLLLRALTAVAGIQSDSDLEALIDTKACYNRTRKDHIGN